MPNGKPTKSKLGSSVRNSSYVDVSSTATATTKSGVSKAKGTHPQARYWILTIPFDKWSVPASLPPELSYIRGQQEIGKAESVGGNGDGVVCVGGVDPSPVGSSPQGYHHWQLVAAFTKPIRLGGVRKLFGPYHAEPTKSKAAFEYVWKDETSVPGSRFELGNKPTDRSSAKDWDKVWEDAKTGDLQSIPPDIRIRSYHTLKRIAKDYCEAPFRENIKVNVFWGNTGTGKSHRMFEEAYAGGVLPYVKSSTTKWWDGYQGQERVIIDEFRGQISIEHILKWFDKYPCYVEEKGGQVALKATTFWVCSNIPPQAWYLAIDPETNSALQRRLTVTHFQDPFSVLIKKLAAESERQ